MFPSVLLGMASVGLVCLTSSEWFSYAAKLEHSWAHVVLLGKYVHLEFRWWGSELRPLQGRVVRGSQVVGRGALTQGQGGWASVSLSRE